MANWLTDGGVETEPLDSGNLVGWVTIAGSETLSAETADPIAGARSAKVVVTNGSSSPGVLWCVNENCDGFAVTPGQTLRASCAVRAVGTGSVRVRVVWDFGYDSVGTLVAPDETTFDVEVTVPEGKVTGTILLDVPGAHSGLTFWFDEVWFGPPSATPPLLTSSAVLSALATRRGVGRGPSRGSRR